MYCLFYHLIHFRILFFFFKTGKNERPTNALGQTPHEIYRSWSAFSGSSTSSFSDDENILYTTDFCLGNSISSCKSYVIKLKD